MNTKLFNAVFGLFLAIMVASTAAEPVARQTRIPCGDAAPSVTCPDGFFCCDAPTFMGDGHCLPEGEICPQ
ncbi:hypothetical protein K435DRAFT_966268 [Dendrothele bispora CBS 962.96]|uniref:CBM1 domain-containing protein n=1 Tax=Dendrothele bispora (strain CBS 962.96) TaxID=1314807 RepID=A0A4S8M1A4_DENBC|nr:hypothetical protein K435DRAFT_966268 [Dendrothele bispora CBS 962.96]